MTRSNNRKKQAAKKNAQPAVKNTNVENATTVKPNLPKMPFFGNGNVVETRLNKEPGVRAIGEKKAADLAEEKAKQDWINQKNGIESCSEMAAIRAKEEQERRDDFRSRMRQIGRGKTPSKVVNHRCVDEPDCFHRDFDDPIKPDPTNLDIKVPEFIWLTNPEWQYYVPKITNYRGFEFIKDSADRVYFDLARRRYNEIPTSEHEMAFTLKRPSRTIPRVVIVDATDIMYQGSDLIDTNSSYKYATFPDVMALLSIMRYFAALGCEVYALTMEHQHDRFMELGDDFTTFSAGLDYLKGEGVACMTIGNAEDKNDVMCWIAPMLEAVIVSNDPFKKQMNIAGWRTDYVLDNQVVVEFMDIPEDHQYSLAAETKDFIAGKTFIFRDRYGNLMTEEDSLKMFFIAKGDEYFKKVQERRRRPHVRDERRRILALLESLIVEGLEVFRKNTYEILKKKEFNINKLVDKNDKEAAIANSLKMIEEVRKFVDLELYNGREIRIPVRKTDELKE